MSQLANASAVSLTYDVASECPPQMEFEAAVKTRGASLKASSPKPPVLALKVQIARRDDGYFGTLQVTGSDAASAEREVYATECGEVVKALAVVTAIALRASDERVPTHDEAAPVAPKAPPREATPPSDPQTKPHLRGTSLRREDEIEVNAGTLRLDRVLDFDLRAGVNYNLVPGVVLPRYELALGVAHFLTPPGGESRLVAPILEAYWSLMGPGTLRKDGYSSETYGLGAGVRSCSALTYDVLGLILSLCAEYGLAWMRLETKNADGSYEQKKETGFGVMGVGMGLQYNLGSHFHLGLRTAGQVQLGGVTAERAGGGTLWRMPLLGAHAVGSAGLHFW